MKYQNNKDLAEAQYYLKMLDRPSRHSRTSPLTRRLDYFTYFPAAGLQTQVIPNGLQHPEGGTRCVIR